MSDFPLHRHYLHYSELPYSQRVLYTATLFILGMGYLFALLNLYFTYAGRAGGNPVLLSYEDIVVAYSGSGKGSRLEAALRGPMSTMLPADERNAVLTWAAEGTGRPLYEKTVAPLLEKRCSACHDGSNPHLPNLIGFDNLKKVTEKDTGANIATLVRVSHIHLFGLTMVFFILGSIFSHAHLRRTRLKSVMIVMPFAALVADIGAWYLTKLYPPFAWVVIGGGLLMGVSFGFMWLVSLWQLWVSPAPQWALGRTRTSTLSYASPSG